MWSVCNPKADGELKECAQLGRTLSRLTLPTILTVLAASAEPLHGYVIVQKAAASPLFGGSKPDATGVYRTLKQMETSGLVTSHWNTPKAGPAKRSFTLTTEGRECLRRWIDSLACYCSVIGELRSAASDALGIELPPLPHCDGHEHTL
ncbi:MAG: helix-turn-helix transcriptional regulator [Coriobacteriales bacterium]|jgi:DNA-binding PadR family transcriptional regulator|nr:helix-turn-helix transcriptional regulator [Coriobacteriales bacterium]